MYVCNTCKLDVPGYPVHDCTYIHTCVHTCTWCNTCTYLLGTCVHMTCVYLSQLPVHVSNLYFLIF